MLIFYYEGYLEYEGNIYGCSVHGVVQASDEEEARNIIANNWNIEKVLIDKLVCCFSAENALPKHAEIY